MCRRRTLTFNPPMLAKILLLYSAIFRFGGLAMALLSAIVSTFIALDVIRSGYILVDGHPSRAIGPIATAVGTPLFGVAIGLALFFLVPKPNK
jgi:hypothetical protein